MKDPKHWDYEPFDVIVSNPPYSIKWEGDAKPILINDERFAPGGVLAPKSKADANISVSSYVEPEDTTEKVDINELNLRIADIVAKENVLRAEIDKIVAELAEVG